MKFVITKAEIDSIIRKKYSFDHDVEIEIVDEYSSEGENGWIQNYQVSNTAPCKLSDVEMIQVVFSDGDTGISAPHNWTHAWNINNIVYITKYKIIR